MSFVNQSAAEATVELVQWRAAASHVVRPFLLADGRQRLFLDTWPGSGAACQSWNNCAGWLAGVNDACLETYIDR